MKANNVEHFVALRAALQQEKATLEARLAEITQALSASGGAAPVATAASGKRHFGAATKAKMAAAQKARWAKIKASQQPPAKPAPEKAKRKLSAEGRAKIIAGTKARWARVRAAKAAK